MKRYLDKDEAQEIIINNFKSVSDFCRFINISRSHFNGMMKGDISCGKKTLKKLEKLEDVYIDDVEQLLEPLPILIGDEKFQEIVITDTYDNLIASISYPKTIVNNDYKVEYIPLDLT